MLARPSPPVRPWVLRCLRGTGTGQHAQGAAAWHSLVTRRGCVGGEVRAEGGAGKAETPARLPCRPV